MQLNYGDAKLLLEKDDSIVGDLFMNRRGEVVPDQTGDSTSDFVRWRIEPIQTLEDEVGPCVELHVFASDGTYETGTYVYARDEFPLST